ncbi:MAG: biotin transporter BioY [Methanospirillum sp.]|nr:biotin transporter BioY [Methanospirillum sp.]
MDGNFQRSVIITHTALFIAMTAVFSWISVPIPFFPVPVTLQTLAVLLTATVMKRNAGIPMVLYIILGSLGLPVFHNGTAGIGILLGPTGGYMIGFIPAALVAGFLYEKSQARIRIGALAAATLIIYLSGLAWLIVSVPMNPVTAAIIGMLPFLPGDIIKAALAYLITERVEPHITRLGDP